MTPKDADHRIILSRHMLQRYNQVVASGNAPADELHLMTNEIQQLERIAEEHPIKAEKIYRLAEYWADLIASIRAKMD